MNERLSEERKKEQAAKELEVIQESNELSLLSDENLVSKRRNTLLKSARSAKSGK
jgi:hypothetical protein